MCWNRTSHLQPSGSLHHRHSDAHLQHHPGLELSWHRCHTTKRILQNDWKWGDQPHTECHVVPTRKHNFCQNAGIKARFPNQQLTVLFDVLLDSFIIFLSVLDFWGIHWHWSISKFSNSFTSLWEFGMLWNKFSSVHRHTAHKLSGMLVCPDEDLEIRFTWNSDEHQKTNNGALTY